MNDFINYTACPVCGQQHISKVLTAKDFTVSGEYFDIFHCNDCTARFTQHAPQGNTAMRYYESANYISHSDTREGIINKLYHAVRKKTLHSKKALIISHTKNKKNLLDIGAGTGSFAFVMQQQGWTVTGIEPDEGARKVALEKHQLSLKSPAIFYNLPAESFDAITLWHVLEHVQDLHEYINHFKKILAPGGILFIAVPNYTSFDATIYREYWAAYDVPRHLYHFSPQSIYMLFEKYGLTVRKIKPMWYDSFYISMLSEKYKNGNTNILKAWWNGLRSNMKALMHFEKCSSVIYIIQHK